VVRKKKKKLGKQPSS